MIAKQIFKYFFLPLIFLLSNCNSDSNRSFGLSNNDSIKKVDSNRLILNTVDSIRKSDSINSSLENGNKKKEGTYEQWLKQNLPEKTDITIALLITQEPTLYSKDFTPTINFIAKNNSDKDIDAFTLSIDFLKKGPIINSIQTWEKTKTVEKTINKNIKSRSESKVKCLLAGNDQIGQYIVTRIHYTDGTIFTN